MTIIERLDHDLKIALVGGDKIRVTTLRSLKNALIYAKVASQTHELSDEEMLDVLAKEAKKRQESADIYAGAQETTRCQQELMEKQIIEEYLPRQLTREEVSELISKVINGLPDNQRSLGVIIDSVKQQTKGQADGAMIAVMVKEKLGV